MAILVDQQNFTTSDRARFACCMTQRPELLAGLSAQEMAQVERLFLHNLASGRAQRVIERWLIGPREPSQRITASWPQMAAAEQSYWHLAYLQQLVQIYRQEGARLQALAQNDNVAWQLLGKGLADSAYRLLVHQRFAPHLAADMALDMAQQACLKIYGSVFPCDIAFDVWAHVILKNQILQLLTRSTELLDRHRYLESLEYLQAEQEDRYTLTRIGQTNNDPCYNLFSSAKQLEDREWLSSVIAQLSSAERRAVIIYTYFDELNDEEIAQKLGKSKGAVHTLRHRALKQLESILVYA